MGLARAGQELPLVADGGDLRPIASDVDGAPPAGPDRSRAALAAGEPPAVGVPERFGSPLTGGRQRQTPGRA
jgi:hypothetical protein